MWIVLLKLCQSCGGEMHISLFDHKPTDEEVETFKRTSGMGGFNCLNTFISELDEMNECVIYPD